MFELSLAALIFVALFTGAALYISLVEHPARLVLPDDPLLAQWQPSYRRALPIQSGLAIAGGLTGLIVWYISSDWRWLAGSIAILANWPYTLIVMMPANKRLMAMAQNQAGAESRALLTQWGRQHAVRGALGAAALALFALGATGL
ncbi:DUF1772 domain-containing protein [Aurantiacibacter rhizosphaerae]|uniref:DUF1772 domain-containing protein n=1 Tax=Aurantiacibacter rhizosphaerae TaxID=2691582 RepID=A0A844XGZ2_9SPHN|nr:DUF1772 domain-containing protein [Aurantiacibacter rhizosphaerae]MWV29009.1 DUF1772 domain-containing protein [Aurantiacibacter rhizosphaerae]